ncbi:Gamma-butyrobetaine hydroxylase-like, N-terminal [Rhabdaerophilaceae bacterium]
MSEQTPWPTEIRVSADRRALAIRFDTGIEGSVPAELLRVRSPSAEVQGHSPSERKTVPGKAHVAILKVEPVGNYAIRISFDDMHDTGVFSWGLLARFIAEQDDMMAEYQAELAAKGLVREQKLPGRS